MKPKLLFVLGLIAIALLAVALNGKITGFDAYNVPRSCTDSDGNDPYKQGTGEYKGLSSAKFLSFTDACRNSGSLLEHYCDGPVHLTESYSCRCQKGACER